MLLDLWPLGALLLIMMLCALFGASGPRNPPGGW